MPFVSTTLRYTLLCVCSTLFHLSTFAQDLPIKFGKIDIADLQMKVYPKDTAAEAVILADYGESYHQYSSVVGLQMIYFRHRRIKILKKAGYDWATHAILTTHSRSGGKEYISDLKGATYNLVDGKIVTEKLSKESIFDEKISEYHSQKKISLPSVKEGSIIEYTYRITSDFDTEIKAWEFQKSIPTIWSEYRVMIPSFYKFQVISQGYEPFLISEKKGENINFGPNVESELGDKFRWVMKDVPALKEEPFMTTIDDYRAQIEFEIAAYTPKGGSHKYYSITWQDFAKTLNDYENFGLQLKKSHFIKDVATNIKVTAKDTLSKVQAAYDYVSKNMTWNGNTSFFSSSNLKKAFETKTGNCADINLLLVVLLRELGLQADPVVLSTRDNGRVLDNYVLERKFNYVIAHTIVDGKPMLLDATEPMSKLGVLPIRCLNENGRLIQENTADWISLSSKEKMSKTLILNMNITPEGQVNGNLDIAFAGYYGQDYRQRIKKETKDKFIENFKKSHPNWEITKTSIEGIEDFTVPLVTKFETSINEKSNVAGNLIYLSPMIGEGEEKNPFAGSERKFPVDFGTLVDETFVATYTIPAGYVIEEIPKSIKVSLPEDGGRFMFVIGTQDQGKITVSSKISLKKTTYLAEEYESLRKFYDQIVQKHAEQIVLKKQ
ncbi:transglutaminase domain-containing protein [Arcicella sp. LKC2W]|uniref:transglutaminase domain-containing protein n=1 Tax=Arcicella sp. LKC2W TaxID=2984198 RepID=UPI002B207A3C|nr:transglutaminase domain-containing protein [Arcicella sp. LKC2W]MEA5461827.1 transglutaminase domain-containing protein [Arcicella sp. LKC2W]